MSASDASPDNALAELAAAHGVSTSFTDWRGEAARVPDSSVVAVLAALGVDAADPAAALRRRGLDGWRRMLPPTVTAVSGRAGEVRVHVPHGSPLRVEVRLEGGGVRPLTQLHHLVDPREVDGALVGEALFELPADLPLGYHELVARSGDETREGGPSDAPGSDDVGHGDVAREGDARGSGDPSARATLIVSPPWVGLPERLGGTASWGLSAQLYSVRSSESWGVGDLGDLADLAVFAGHDLGADFLLVNPLHAAEPVAPLEPSPYLPSSRRFFHPLYLRIESVPEYARLSTAERDRVDALAAHVHARLDASDAIDRDTAWTAKRAALELLHRMPRSAGRELDYRAYREREGAALTCFAAWSVIATEHGNDARTWPEELRDSGSAAVADFVAARSHEADLACWLQWQLDEQLQRAQSKAVGAGMALGTMHDLAVGVHPGGADAWANSAVYAAGIRVGAPPDPFTQLGQDWQQPPWRPDRLAETGYAPLRDTIRAVLRHAGGVRIDHVIGLFRLWWVPEGATPADGAYVYYDHEATIGVLALEAHRAGAVVVGEDLGVVDPHAREYLASRGILGTSILWFERDGDDPLPAERWRELCLATVTTHDLPPTAAYLAGEHVRLRERLGLLTRDVEEELAADEADRGAWLAELRRRGLLPDGDAPVERTVEALHRYLALTPSRLLGLSLTDAVGDRRTQNQPGTLDEYPNWRVPLSGPDGAPLPLEDVFASERVRALARVLRDRGGR